MPRDAPWVQHDVSAIDADGALYCASCRSFATRTNWGMSMAGRHEHRLTNPAGQSFVVVCFEKAPGALEAGERSRDFSWFPGYWWQVALCATCGTQLGWRYGGGDSPEGFYGLIKPRLTANPARS